MKSVFLILILVISISLIAFHSTKPVSASPSEKGPVKIIRVSPYSCGQDTCAGYRCVGDIALDQGTSVSPACYNVNQLETKNCKNGEYMKVSELANICTQNEYFFVWTR